MTASDGPRHEHGDSRADGARSRGDESSEEPAAGRFDRYFEYVLDLLSFL